MMSQFYFYLFCVIRKIWENSWENESCETILLLATSKIQESGNFLLDQRSQQCVMLILPKTLVKMRDGTQGRLMHIVFFKIVSCEVFIFHFRSRILV